MEKLDTTSRYLVTQFSIINVFASTTSFNHIEQLSNIDFEEKESTIFSDYLEKIHAITVEERKRASLRDLGVVVGKVDLTLVATNLEDACDNTRNLTHQLRICTEQLKRDFDRVIDIYNQSGLIYAYQALGEPGDATECIAKLLKALLDELILIPTGGPFAQDLPWPLFICGTACRHLENEQRLLERLMKEVMDSTGFSHCQEALNFLKAYWSSENIEGETWIDFARRHSKRRREFLAL